MGGCSNGSAKGGCDDRKSPMFATMEKVLGELYPTKVWGETSGLTLGAGISDEDIAALAEELATELNGAAFVRPGDDDEPCDYIYVLAMGRPPCALQVRDFGVPPPAEWSSLTDDKPITELYLRLTLSQLAPLAAVQQCAFEVRRTVGDGPTGYSIVESARAGVYDAPLLRRMQRLVSILPAYGLTHLDFGDISAPQPGYSPGIWADLYGGEPATSNYFFSPRPATLVTSAWRAE